MKSKTLLFRLTVLSALLALVGSSVSCMTTYDSYGRPVQSVDPAVAIAGVAAAGLIGYAASNNNDHHDHHYRGGYYSGGGYYGGDCY
jgi:homoserine acetyltransferase